MSPPLPPLRVEPPLEKDVHRACMNFYRTIGVVVHSTAQARRSKVALGLPDLILAWPARGVHWCHEVKREGGKLSPDQVKFRDTWLAAGGLYVVGGLQDAVRFVEEIRGARK
jgi:hypothetical protein